MIQTQENGKRPHFGPDLGPLSPNSGHHFFLIKLLFRHCCQLSSYVIQKRVNQTWENCKKPNFGSNFGLFSPNLVPSNFFLRVLPLLDVRHCHKLSLYAISSKMYDPNSIKWQKT